MVNLDSCWLNHHSSWLKIAFSLYKQHFFRMVKSPSWSTPVTSQAAVPIAGPETGPRPRSAATNWGWIKHQMVIWPTNQWQMLFFFARNMGLTMGLTMGWTVGLTMGFISNLTSFVGETWWLTMGFFIKTKLVVFNWSCHTHQLWYIVMSSYQENLQYIIQHSSNPTIYICGWLHCHVYRKECWIICILSNNPILRYVVRVPVSKGYTFSEGKHS